MINFLASGEFCCLKITFASSLDPDQNRQNKMSVLLWIQTIWHSDLLKTLILKKVSWRQQKQEKLSASKELNIWQFVAEEEWLPATARDATSKSLGQFCDQSNNCSLYQGPSWPRILGRSDFSLQEN